MRILTRLFVTSIAAGVLLSTPLASAPPKVPLLPTVPQSGVAAGGGRRAKGRPDRLGGLCRRQAKRLHRGGAAVHARAADELHERRRHHDVGDQDLGRRQHRRVPARRGAEPRGLVAQPFRGPQRAGTRDLGGATPTAPAARGGWSTPPIPNWRRMAARFYSSKGGQIYRAKLTPVKPASEVDRGEKAFITEWGVQSDPKWSPDGRKIAFVSTRTDHSFIVGVRRCDANGEVHVAERGLRHDCRCGCPTAST